jgi:hypothetical protein
MTKRTKKVGVTGKYGTRYVMKLPELSACMYNGGEVDNGNDIAKPFSSSISTQHNMSRKF